MTRLDREDLEKTCRGYAEAFADVVPEGVGFAIFLFDFGHKGNTAYVSTAAREDMRRLVREWLEREENPPP